MNVVRGDKLGNKTFGVGKGRGNFSKQDSVIACAANTALPSNIYGARSRPTIKTPAGFPKPCVTSRSFTTTTTSGSRFPGQNTSTSGCKKRPWTSASSTGAQRTTSSDLVKTPKSISTSFLTDNNDSNCCIIALSEGRGQARGEVGIAALDVRRPHLTLCQISDTQSYVKTLTKINVFNPIEILVPNTFCDGQQQSKLFTNVRDMCPNVTLTTVQRRHFSDSRGLQQIQHLCIPEYASVEMLIHHKFYALSSASALLKYVEFINNVIFAPKSLKVVYQGSQNTTVIDVESSRRLELVRSLRGSCAQHSLLGILNRCSTGGGARLLRASLLQPPCLLADVLARQICVAELVDKPELFHALEGVLSKFQNVEHLLSLCMHLPQENAKAAETQLNYTLLLKTTLELLPPLKEILETAQADFFVVVKENLGNEQYARIMDRILETVHVDARMVKGYAASHMHRSFLVKPNLNGLLDIARKTYCEIVEDLTQLVAELADTYNLPLKVNYTSSRGFHIQLINMKNNIKPSDLSEVFIQVQKNRSSFTFTTQDLVHRDHRAKESLNEIQHLSNLVIYHLLKDIRVHMGCVYKLCEHVAELDMLVSLTHISSVSNYVRPQFGAALDVRKARHPMLDFVSQLEPEPNDIQASRHFNCQIITGPNMSGKSIYIRQIALLQIMAQIGCYVPAESATFRIADHIFTRIGFDDSIECNASTFVLEIRELQYIKQTLTENSLVIVDELCRGTSSEEGTAIAFALCEDLLQSDAFIFLTTHFLFLTKLEDLYCNVTNTHFEVVEEETEEGRSRLRYTHRLLPGITQVEKYGLRLAEASAMPKSVVRHANELATTISANRKAESGSAGTNELKSDYRLVLSVLQILDANDLSLEKCIEIQEMVTTGTADNATDKEGRVMNMNVETTNAGVISLPASPDSIAPSHKMASRFSTPTYAASPLKPKHFSV